MAKSDQLDLSVTDYILGSDGKSPEGSNLDDDSVLILFARLRKARLCAPALLLLEMHRPLQMLFHAGALIASPFLVLLFGPKLVGVALSVLESQQQFDRLVELLRVASNRDRG